MTAKEKLRERIEALTEEEASETQRLLDLRSDPRSRTCMETEPAPSLVGVPGPEAGERGSARPAARESKDDAAIAAEDTPPARRVARLAKNLSAPLW